MNVQEKCRIYPILLWGLILLIMYTSLLYSTWYKICLLLLPFTFYAFCQLRNQEFIFPSELRWVSGTLFKECSKVPDLIQEFQFRGFFVLFWVFLKTFFELPLSFTHYIVTLPLNPHFINLPKSKMSRENKTISKEKIYYLNFHILLL